MDDFLRRFLRHGFDATFLRYDAGWLALAEDLAAEQRELIESDLGAKYPAMAGQPYETQLARVLECDAPMQAVLLYRLAHALFRRASGHEALPYFAQLMRVRSAIELYYSATIGPRLHIIHGAGAVIGPRCEIGSDFSFYQGITLGQKRPGAGEFVTVGDRCTIFAGAKVIGKVRLGDNVHLGANAVLLQDAEANGVYGGIPAARIAERVGGS